MKKALSLFLALILCLSLSLPALAAAPTDATQPFFIRRSSCFNPQSPHPPTD